MSAEEDIFKIYDSVVFRMKVVGGYKIFDQAKAMDQAINIYQMNMEEKRIAAFRELIKHNAGNSIAITEDDIEYLSGKKKPN